MASTMTPTTPLPDYEEAMPAGPQHGSGSIAPFFAVMSIIVVLTVLSCIFGWVCAAHAAGPDAWYDCMGWWRRRCTLHRNTVRETKAAVVAHLEPKPKENSHLSQPQP